MYEVPVKYRATYQRALSESMDWVAENLGVSVTRHDAPSRVAWSIYDTFKANRSEFFRLYLSRRYKPEKEEDDYFDITEGLSTEGEDVGLPGPIGGRDALPDDSDRCVAENRTVIVYLRL